SISWYTRSKRDWSSDVCSSDLYYNPIQENVAKALTEKSSGDLVFFANSGAEANEAAIKLARKATNKEEVITFNQSFHGRTFATRSEERRVGKKNRERKTS